MRAHAQIESATEVSFSLLFVDAMRVVRIGQEHCEFVNGIRNQVVLRTEPVFARCEGCLETPVRCVEIALLPSATRK